MTTRAEFLKVFESIGMNPEEHDIDELHAAYDRLDGLFRYLETDESREAAKVLARFDPRDPL